MMQRMKIRDKMTLWYTLLTFAALAAFCLTLYWMIAGTLEEMLERDVRLSMTQITAQIENENDALTYENEVPVSSGSMFFITEENGSELASYGADITLFDQVPIEENVFRVVQSETERWLLLDSALISVDYFNCRVRVAASCATNDLILYTLRLICGIGLPLIILLAFFGGRVIAKRSFVPVSRIIHGAQVITKGDLSARIPPAPAKDEIGELTDTLNQMLESLEMTFARQKRFTSDASHELRTPVAIVRAYSESLLADQTLSDEQREGQQTILREAERMQRMIAQLLTLTRGEEGRCVVHREPLALWVICEGVADTLKEQMAKKQIGWENRVPDDLMLNADQSLMTQALLNLVENAVKYGREGGYVRVSAEAGKGEITLRVSDNGMGISQEALPHVFERFYREDTARDRSGTGLGLSIVQWIVLTHEGSIDVQSVKGQGTTFVMRFPCG